MRIKFFLLTLIIFPVFSCKYKPKATNTVKSNITLDKLPTFQIDTFIDKRDLKTYRVVTIGNQTWTCGFIQYEFTNKKKYRGYLYDWETAEVACLESFNIPSDNDWNQLIAYIDSAIITKASPRLKKELMVNEEFKCEECRPKFRKGRLPYGFKWTDSLNKEEHQRLISAVLEKIGFCTSGTGFKYNSGYGTDDYSYFWSSTTTNRKSHKHISLYTGDYCQGCGNQFNLSYSDNYGFNLKCLKKVAD